MACNCIVIAREVWDTRDLATQVLDEKNEIRASALQTRFEPEDLNALEIALRLRLRELVRTLSHLQPNDGLNTTRQVGTGDCFLGMGLRTDGSLVLRPTIIGDASGYFCLNLILAPEAAKVLRDWLGGDSANV